MRLQKTMEQQLQQANLATVDIGEVERIDDMESTWRVGSENLTALKSGLGGTIAKMERAQQAVDYIEEEQ
jgi:kinetochor protein Mis14/NSL1